LAQFDTDEIIKVKAGKLSRNYKGYKGTFAALAYNCIHKRALPGLYYEKDLIVGARQETNTLSVTISGCRPENALMDIMDIALENSSAFPVDTGEADFSINVE
jgi:hypothetical protein